MILAIDQGTTGTTSLVVDGELGVRGRGYRDFPQYYPQPGWVEHDPEELWESVLGAAEEAYVLVAPEGNHGAWIADLAPDDRALAMQALADWTGVTPRAAVTRPAEPLRERMLLRGW